MRYNNLVLLLANVKCINPGQIEEKKGPDKNLCSIHDISVLARSGRSNLRSSCFWD